MENIVSRAGKSVRTHTAIVLRLVGGLTVAFEGYNDLVGTDVGIVDDVAALGLCHEGRVYDNGFN